MRQVLKGCKLTPPNVLLNKGWLAKAIKILSRVQYILVVLHRKQPFTFGWDVFVRTILNNSFNKIKYKNLTSKNGVI